MKINQTKSSNKVISSMNLKTNVYHSLLYTSKLIAQGTANFKKKSFVNFARTTLLANTAKLKILISVSVVIIRTTIIDLPINTKDQN